MPWDKDLVVVLGSTAQRRRELILGHGHHGWLLRHLKRLITAGENKRGSDEFLFTDKEVVKHTFFKGLLHSFKLHQMIMELRKMKMRGNMVIHFIWIFGKCMIDQGTDRLSWANVSSGVMGGQMFLVYLPLDKTAFERQGELKSCIMSWVGKKWKVAITESWFNEVYEGPLPGWIWCPLPALTKVVVEQLCNVRYLYPYFKHIFVCPSLMKGYWLMTLGKVANSVFVFKAGLCVWSAEMCESNNCLY